MSDENKQPSDGSKITVGKGQIYHKHWSETYGEYIHAHLNGDADHGHYAGKGNEKYLGVATVK